MVKRTWTRRELLRSSAVAAGSLMISGAAGPLAFAAGSDTIRVGVIGCGGRGSGATENCVASSPGVKVVALADTFEDRLQGLKTKFNVPSDRCFVGMDAYKKLLAVPDVNLVILATPPGFRPIHLAAAIQAGKNVFMEKPVCVCPAGYKMVVETSEEAQKKGLAIVCGTQRRHEGPYVEAMKRIHDGAIGDIVSAQCYWNMGELWVNQRKPGQGDVDWQIRNWLYFTWLSGDHIVEQHVHNLDVVNWAFQDAQPEMVHGLGGRQWRTGPEYGNIFDHFGVEFTYPNDVRTISMCRQIKGTTDNVSERVVGTKGIWLSERAAIEGEHPWKYEGPHVDPYVQEHTDLIKSIRDGRPLNEGKRIADSTLCAVMGRESAYSRQQFKRSWFLTRCTLDLRPPDDLQLSDAKPVPPFAIPGQYQLPGWVPEQRRRG
jgi:predicted dehydrogenase